MASSGSIVVHVDAELSPAAARIAALDMACRVVRPDGSTGYFLSTARQFETYLLTGITQTGPRDQQGAQVGSEGVSVLVDAPGLAPEVVESLRKAVAAALAPQESAPWLCDVCHLPFLSKDCDHVGPFRSATR